MLRHARPKSQPALQYTPVAVVGKQSAPETISEQLPAQARYTKQPVDELIKAPSASLSNISAGSCSSSSDSEEASSLGSSSLSLSTNSSTSTVLANLQACKKLPARPPGSGPLQITKKFDSSSSEDDGEEQLHSSSSSSSTSSSSGLSSMNSKSSLALASQSELPQTREVEECVEQLVESVVRSEQEASFSTFKLDEVVLAQTTISSGSSDEEGGSAFAKTKADQAGKLSNVNGKICLIRELEINSELQSDAFILHSARRYIASVLAQRRKSKAAGNNTCWFVSLLAREQAIEWTESNRLDQSERLGFEHIAQCLLEEQLLVWVIERKGNNKLGCSSSQELETTLDDIALALDEPLDGVGKLPVEKAAERRQPEAYGVETLIWLCSSEEEARGFFDHFQAMRATFGEQVEPLVGLERQTNDLSIGGGNKRQPEASADLNQLNSGLRKQSGEPENENDDQEDDHRSLEREPAETAVASFVSETNEPAGKRAGSAAKQTTSTSIPASKGQREKEQKADKVSGTKLAGGLRKAASGLDLSVGGGGQPAVSLASYYRSVANKVISNGQSKIKSLKDEMAKLNNRTSSSSQAAKRVPAAPTSKSLSSPELPAAANNRNLSSASKSNERIATSSVVAGAAGPAPSARSPARQPAGQQVPEIKPRTSILKNRLQRPPDQFTTSNSCDINNNTLQQRKPDADQSVARARLSAKSEPNAKPKSILKSSKSVSNIAPASQQTIEKLNGNNSPVFADRQNLRANANLRSMRRVQPPTTALQAVNTINKRRSCAVLVNNRNNDDDEDDEDEEALVREQSFERLRMRASCYDISRLMSKNGLQNQLGKLRADSGSSIAAKSRQRRPALLIDNSTSSTPPPPPAATIATSKSDANGLVRASVTLEQQQLGAETLADSSTQQSKRSEFDPRSLRRMAPLTGNSQSSVSVVNSSESNVAERAERRKSVTMIKFTSNGGQKVEPRAAEVEPSEATSGTVVCVSKEPPPPATASRKAANDGSASRKTQEDDRDNDDDDDSSLTELDDSETQPSQAGGLTKSGPFSLLRQSFSQKSISSMLKFSSRASLRVKAPPATSGQQQPEAAGGASTGSGAKLDKATAIAVAEANLLAAKQLKQQAQKLKEQQKRELQQQAALLDPTSVMLAVQYNQQVQRHQHQQQQQILYQQYAIAARGQMFDASGMHLQHAQMMMQRQQQQQQQQHQMASYIASVNNQAHYMAQQMAAAAAMQHPPAAAVMATTHHHHHQQQLMYSAGAQQQAALHNPAGLAYRKSILKGANGGGLAKNQEPFAGQPAQLIPMSVNHHSSSFNIVYSAAPAQSVVAEQPVPPAQATLAKHSSLGASMRKTVKSILVNRSAFLSSSSPAAAAAASNQAKPGQPAMPKEVEKQQVKALKSALKSRPLILNSEGSDSGDGSSSDSTTTATTSSVDNNNPIVLPKSVLKKGHRQLVAGGANEHDDDDDDDNLSTSSNEAEYSRRQQHKSNTLTQASVNELRQRLKASKGSNANLNYSTLRASTKRKSIAASSNLSASNSSSTTSGRKNVTFSTKLTSIL